MKAKVAHLTSVHDRTDSRIFYKECCSLRRAGYSVNLVVADGRGHEVVGGVNILDVGRSSGRIDRIRNAPSRILNEALRINADLYHIHDPELIPVGLRLKKMGKRVLFDAHEDFPKQVLNKPYLGRYAKIVVSRLSSWLESYACARLDGIVAATPSIRDKFLKIHSRSIAVANYPILGELERSGVCSQGQKKSFCYVGALTFSRGIADVVGALALSREGAKLILCGKFQEADLESAVRATPSWVNVEYLGYLGRDGVRDVLARSIAGIVVVHPKPNHLESLPIKMFEYMAAGIPVVASNFPLWREIIETADCGICVEAQDGRLIAGALDFLLANPDEALRLGRNGQKAIATLYNWSIEESKLVRFYEDILGDSR